MKFNTLIKYTRIPDEDDLSMSESECTLLSKDPFISYFRPKQNLRIIGPDVDINVKAKNIHIEEK